MKKVEYVIQKFVAATNFNFVAYIHEEWVPFVIYSENEFKKASDDFKEYTNNYKLTKFRLVKRTTVVTEEEVFQETF